MDIEPKLQYDLIKLYVYYNTRINLPLLTKTQVIDQNTGKPAMREIKTKDSKEKKIVKTEPIKVRNKLPLYYMLTFDSQYSFDTLYGSDQFSVGGEYIVRGFRESNISGDIGYYIRNDLKINLLDLLPNAIVYTKPMNVGKQHRISINDMISRTYLSAFFDYGYVRNRHKILPDYYNSNSGYLSSAGIALDYCGRYLS